MGCGDSKLENAPLATINHQDLTLPESLYKFLPAAGPLTALEYRDRIFSTKGSHSVQFPQSQMTIRYAIVSQRGYYPESPDKPNQDAVCAYQYFGNQPEQLFFGVFDGHGNYGTSTAQFAKDKVPGNLLQDPLFQKFPEAALRGAAVLTNAQLHKSPIDDSLSGTTAIMALVRGKMLYVANVGDSRAVLGEMRGSAPVAVPLSSDQTPFRKDEVARVRAAGARVMTLDQMEGIKPDTYDCWSNEELDGADPPRLWMPDAMFPGTAFTRSIGDSAAERIGVFAEPEVVSKALEPQHRYLVLASDGVFEFLKNQVVIDLVAKYSDPQEAAIALVVEAYRQWLANEVRTDDITTIVVFFEHAQDNVPPRKDS